MKVWQANLAEHERAKADFMQQWQRAAARSPPSPAWSSQPAASPRSSWNPPAAASPRSSWNPPAAAVPSPRSSWNPPRDAPARPAPRPSWNSNPQPAPVPGPRTSPRLTNSWSQSRTQPPQATTSWDDGNGGSANVWSTGSAYQSFVDSTGDNSNSNNNNQRFNRRVGQSSIAGPRQRNTAASASPAFNWPEMPSGPQPIRNADGASQPYSYGFEIEHGPATNAKANAAGGVSSTYASGYNN